MRALRRTGFVVLILVLAGILIGFDVIAHDGASTDRAQASLQPFYDSPDRLPGPPGTVIRTESMDVTVPGGHASRMLFVSARPDGTPAASSAMVFIPDAPAPATGRRVLAWAHGTLGQGDACAPSRSTDPVKAIASWLEIAMAKGWLVVAPDYTGLGTAGPNLYLIGQAEARDVVESVRAARTLPDAHAGTDWAVFGHSQGGHASLWTGELAQQLAPELHLRAVAAAAPAAELVDIIDAQWQSPVSWVIGPEVAASWPVHYPNLSLQGFLTQSGIDSSPRLANECIKLAALEGLARTKLGQQYFARLPSADPSWKAALVDQTPLPLPRDLPVWVGQSLTDDVVLAWPNGVLQEKWCAAGTNLTTEWISDVTHMQTGLVMGPSAMQWLDARFAGVPATSTCDVPPPVSAPTTQQ